MTDFKITSLGFAQKIYREFNPDITVCFGGPESVIANLIERSFGKRNIIRFRGHALNEGALSRFRERLSVKFSRGIVVPGRAIELSIRAINPKKRVEMIALGCDQNIFKITRSQLNENRDLLVVGRLDPVKGHERSFEIYSVFKSLWKQKYGDLYLPKLKIIGESANLYPENLHSSANRVGLRDGIDYRIINEKVPNIAEEMETSLIGIVPSIGSEYICRVAEEFLLVGTPVFVSGVGSLEDCLFPGAGVTYLGSSIRDSAESLVVLADQTIREKFETKVLRQEEAARRYSLPAMASSWDRYLTSIFGPL